MCYLAHLYINKICSIINMKWECEWIKSATWNRRRYTYLCPWKARNLQRWLEPPFPQKHRRPPISIALRCYTALRPYQTTPPKPSPIPCPFPVRRFSLPTSHAPSPFSLCSYQKTSTACCLLLATASRQVLSLSWRKTGFGNAFLKSRSRIVLVLVLMPLYLYTRSG